MKDRLFGIETEYAFAVVGRTSIRRDRERAVQRLFELARLRLPHLPGGGSAGIFLANGSRFYTDSGMHPELTTPECSTPRELVRYLLANEQILAGLVDELNGENGSNEVILSRCNVDHCHGHASFGCHESFLHRADPRAFQSQLVPHLVSRLIYTGAGGLLAREARIAFTLSPRVVFLQHEVSGSSTNDRGILHTKDESLSAAGYHRLHLICGEGLCSQKGSFLKMGVTALVVALIEAGLRPGDGVQLADSVTAMRTFAGDPSCRTTVPLKNGAQFTAIDIQRRYLAAVEEHLQSPFLPSWAEEVCRVWRETLDALGHGAPDSVATQLDWSIKLSLFRNRARRCGLDWDALDRATAASVQELRQELYEIDMRFSQIGGRRLGVFNALRRAGVLDDQVADLESIEQAVEQPPAVGRARLRGEWVRRLAGQNGNCSCGWTSVHDNRNFRYLDLSDPFQTEEKWVSLPQPATSPLLETLRVVQQAVSARVAPIVPPQPPHPAFESVVNLYERGCYEEAHAALQRIEAGSLSVPVRRYRAWIQARRGFPDGAVTLDAIARETVSVNDYLEFYSGLGLGSPPQMEEWIRRGERFVPQMIASDPRTAAAFLGYKARHLMRTARPRAALDVLERACEHDLRWLAYPTMLGRILADRGEVNRLLGDRREALYWLREAGRFQKAYHLDADLADSTFLYRAKLEPSFSLALRWLTRALSIQTRSGNRVGEARSLLLQARLSSDMRLGTQIHQRILQLHEQLPALAQCALLSKVLARWAEWTSGELTRDANGDEFWGV